MLTAVLTAAAACTGVPPAAVVGMHEAGDGFGEARVHHGIPILQRSFFWDGNGEVDDSGIGGHVGSYLTDDLAVGVGGTLASWWTGGRDVHSLEAEGMLRWHPCRGWPLFLDGSGGYQLANDQIPPGGTVWNFTFAFGGGVELPLAAHTALITGVDYHHISNALGRENDRNPSQNEARLWLGVQWTF